MQGRQGRRDVGRDGGRSSASAGKTAERMRDAVENAFGPLELAESNDNQRTTGVYARMPLRRLAPLSAEELAELEAAAGTLWSSTGFESARGGAAGAGHQAPRHPAHRTRWHGSSPISRRWYRRKAWPCDPAPGRSLDRGLLACSARGHHHLPHRRAPLPVAIHRPPHSRQRIEPYGLLYGNRAFLVGRTDWNDAMRLWRLGNM